MSQGILPSIQEADTVIRKRTVCLSLKINPCKEKRLQFCKIRVKVSSGVAGEHHFTEGIAVYALLTIIEDLKERNCVHLHSTPNINAWLKHLPVFLGLNGWKIVYEL